MTRRNAERLVDAFLEQYSRERDYYSRLADSCKDYLSEILLDHGIQAIVTARAKSVASLRSKLVSRTIERERDRRSQYKTLEEIRADIPDLAGVRAALYFPGDRDLLATVLPKYFPRAVVKHFPHDRSDSAVFSGYGATHYRVPPLWKLAEELIHKRRSRDSERGPQKDDIVEIQIASVLMHAWAEVEHDLVYKPHSGTLSREELALLDQVNGLVLCGETALKLLREAAAKRIASRSSDRFENEFELAAFLAGEVFSPELVRGSNKVRMLLIGLRIVNLDHPAGVREIAGSVEVGSTVDAVSQLLHQIIVEFPRSADGILRTFAVDVWSAKRGDNRLGGIDAMIQRAQAWAAKVRRKYAGNARLPRQSYRHWRHPSDRTRVGARWVLSADRALASLLSDSSETD